MDLPILSAAAISLAAFVMAPGADALRQSASTASKAEGPAALVGQTLWASEEPVSPWGEALRAEDMALEGMGRVARVVTSPEGEAEAIVVAVGGLWGYGAQEVELGLERVHLVPAAAGGERLVVDLSSAGAEPPIDGAEL